MLLILTVLLFGFIVLFDWFFGHIPPVGCGTIAIRVFWFSLKVLLVIMFVSVLFE